MKVVKSKLFFLFGLLAFWPITLFSQENDFGLWTGVSGQLKLGKRFEVTAEEQLRLRNNAQSIEQLLTEFGLGFKLNKRIDFAVNYRYAYKEFAIRHRVNFDVAVESKFNKKLSLVNRFRYQVQYRFNEDIRPKFRHKIGIDYNLNKKAKANLDTEIFYAYYYDFKNFSGYRLKSTFNYKLTDWLRWDIFALYQTELNDEYPVNEIITGTGFKIYFN